MLVAVAALALDLSIAAPNFTEAFARAKVYSADPKGRDFLDHVFFPKIGPDISRLVGACAQRLKPTTTVYFTVVITYKNAKPDGVLLEKDDPFGRCVAEGMTQIVYPEPPPYPDFAEDIEFTVGK